MLLVPLELDAEYRGRVDSRDYSFTDRTTGQAVEGSTAEVLKFEYDVPGQEGVQLQVRLDQVDKAADFDAHTLKRGDRVVLRGSVRCAERGDDRGSRVDLVTVRRAGKLAPAQAA